MPLPFRDERDTDRNGGDVVGFVCRALLFGVFLVALVGKARDPGAFADSVAVLSRTSRRTSRVLAVAVVATEAAVLVLLAVPATVPAGFVLAAALLLVFAAGIAWALHRGHRAPCRCFGASATPLGRVHVARNLLLACTGTLAPVADTPPPPEPGAVLVGLLVAAVGVLVVTRLDDVAAVFPAGK
ncbi:MauE/DoxX family redox-associated membrane protein [Saccharothrix yanglingensis]|uniref:MauE/DoxX family redox-associated membrane protein n=1 Tax=Saccharothrix yanglingensis TaxID=659496 RepID=UPI0027D34396|nr:MauE/DoxX family redox-associated membrane protein [Saccharothrix yanglingensis]